MKNFEKMKRALSILLCLCMVLGMFPSFTVTAHAHDEAEIVAPVMATGEETPICDCAGRCTEPNAWCDACGFDITACTGEAKPAEGGMVANSVLSSGTVYVHLTLKAVDVSGNEVTTGFDSYIDQDVIDNREGYGAEFYVGYTYYLSGFDIDGYTVKDEEITFTVSSSGNISITSGNASVEYGGDTTYIVIPVNSIDGDRVTIDCSTINLNVHPYQAWGTGWHADGSVDLHELILTEPYIFILENSESMTKDNVEYIRILNGAILEAGTLTDGVLVYAENGKIQSGTFISQVNVYADGEICGGTFNNVYNKGVISAGTFNGELTNHGTIINNGDIQLGEGFVLVQNGNVECNAHIWRNGICRLCGVTCQHSWENGTCTVCGEVCSHTGGEATCTTLAVCDTCGVSYGEVADHSTTAEATCSTKAVCALCGEYGEKDATKHNSAVKYENGFCPNGCYEPAIDSDSDGYYEIDNGGNLFWFAQLVNGGETSANAILTGEINLEDREWTPIANYAGTFDGAAYGITNLNIKALASNAGLFGAVSGTVKNLSVSGSVTVSANGVKGVGVIGVLQNGGVAQGIISHVNITMDSGITGTCYIGGVVGTLWGTVTECAYYGNISLGDAAVDQTGGIAAYVEYNATAPVITNCGFYGSITTTNTDNSVGGIMGYSRNSKLTLENCLSVGSLPDSGSAVTAFGVINAAPASITGLYYLEGSAPNATANSGSYSYTPADGIITAASADQLKSGEVAYLLGEAWGKTIDTDAYPTPGGAVVYQYKNCDGTTLYTNNSELSGTNSDHDFSDNGFCKACDGYEPAVLNDNGVYEIGNAGQLYWFGHNGGNAGAILTANIVVNKNVLEEMAKETPDPSGFRQWIPIGNGYSGTFDGQGYSISGLYYNGAGSNVGLFGSVQKGTIQNLGVLDSWFYSSASSGNVGSVVGRTDYTSYVFNCYSDSTVSGACYVGGIVGNNDYAFVRNSFFIGTVIGSDGDVGPIVGRDNHGTMSNAGGVYDSFYLDTCGTSSYGTAKSAKAFASGEVAYLMSQGKNGEVWGQDIGTDDYPVLYGEKVYYGYLSCADDEKVYTNDSTAVADKPDHTLDEAGYTVTDNTHSYTCEVCKGSFTEEHSYDATTLRCVCGVYHSDVVATVSKNGTVVAGYTALSDAVTAVNGCTAEDKAVLTLRKDVDLGENYLTISGGVFKLDLNGHEIKGTDVYVLDIDSGTVELTGGKISGTGTGVGNSGTLKITGGEITAGYYGVHNSSGTVEITSGVISASGIGKVYGVYNGGGTTKISGGQISASGTGVAYGVCIGGGTVDISGGSFVVGESGRGVSVSNGEVTVSGGTFTIGKSGNGVYVDGGKATVSGGTFTVEDSGNGVYVNGGEATVTGGTFTVGELGKGMCIWDGEVTVSDGSFTVGYSGCGLHVSAGNATVSGGTFKTGRYGSSVSRGRTGTVRLTLAEGKTEGATFLGGINVNSTTLNDILGEGAAYWQGEKMIIPSEEQIEITGGDVVIKKPCTHTAGTITYTDNGDGTHTYTYSCCSVAVTEGHSYDETTLLCVCGAYHSDVVATVSKNGTVVGAYTSLASAVSAVYSCTADDKAVLTLRKDVDLGSSNQGIYGGVFTLDLGGHEIKGTGTYVLNISGGTVEITGGKISGTGTGVNNQGTLKITGGEISIIGSKGVHGVYNNGGNVEITGGKISAVTTGAFGYGVHNSDGTVKITGGEISGDGVSWGYGVHSSDDLEISGGTFSVGDGNRAVYVADGTTNISDGTFNVGASGSGVIVYGGKATVTGGTFNIGEAGFGVEVSGGEVAITGGAFTVGASGSGVIVKEGKATVTGGTFNIGEAGFGVNVSDGEVTITGGTFTVGDSGEGVYSGSGTAKISGGSFAVGKYGTGVKVYGTVEISGGSFIVGDYGYAVYIYDASVDISGGTFAGGTGWTSIMGVVGATATLTIAEGKTEGATFRNGIIVWGTSLNNVLGEGAAYWQGLKMVVPSDTATSITGGDVVIRSTEASFSGWVELSGQWYYVDPETGEMATGIARVPYPEMEIDGVTYAPDQEAIKYAEDRGNTHIDKDTGLFWFDENGVFKKDYTGFVPGEAYTSWADKGHIAWHPGLVKVEDQYYYFHGNVGVGGNIMGTGDLYASRDNTDFGMTIGGVYTFGSDGVMCHYEGITEVNGVLRYYENAQLMMGKGLIVVNDNYYYVRSNGELVVDRSYWVAKTNGLGVTEGSYVFDENGVLQNPTYENINGVLESEDGKIYYFVKGRPTYVGLIQYSDGRNYDNDWIYVKSDGTLVTGQSYWITKTNGNMYQGYYNFDEKGRMTDPGNAPSTDDSGEVKNGLVPENGGIYYYKDGEVQYSAGLIELEGSYYYVRTNGQLALGNYWVTNHNGLVVEGMYTFDKLTGAMVGTPVAPPAAEETFTGVKDGYYYENGQIVVGAGLIELEEGYYYVRSNGQVATGEYYVTNVNDLPVAPGIYTFDASGVMIG